MIDGEATVRATGTGQVLQQVTDVQPAPSHAVALGAAVVALLAVLIRDSWMIGRNLATIAHEAGHALVALLVGRRLSGIRLHSDTSGVTVSRGRPDGPGVVVTAAAGYPAPSLLGLACAALLANGHITALLWLIIVLVAAMLIEIRNAYGVLVIVVTGGVVFLVSWFTAPQVQGAFADLFTWFLLFAGIRPVWELQRSRMRRRTPESDADQLAQLTGVPALVWVIAFGLFGLGVLAMAVAWLLPIG